MARKKKTYAKTIHSTILSKEAEASCSLDGSTQCCMACVLQDQLAWDISDYKKIHSQERKDRVLVTALKWFDRPVHTCGLRLMTAAERELVEASLTPEPWLGVDYRRFELCIEAVRAERKEKT